MKDQILKIAKVKSEKEFYKKYPTEEAFMKAHGKAFKKAAMGAKMVDTQLEQLTDFSGEPKAQVGTMLSASNQGQNTMPIFRFQDALTNAEAVNAGISKEELLRQKALEKDAPEQSNDSLGGLGEIIGQGISMLGDDEGGDIVKDLPIHKYGGELHKAQFGDFLRGVGAKSGGLGNLIGDTFGGDKGAQGIMGAVGGKDKGLLGMEGGLKSLGKAGGLKAAGKAAGLGVLNAAPDIINGFGQMKEQKNAIAKADQQSQVTGLTAQAAESKQVGVQKHNFVRPEDAGLQQGQLNNPQGVGSNFLQMQDGGQIGGNLTEIQNTYNSPVDLYSDLGFEPLDDNNIKQYQNGGKSKKLVSRHEIETYSYGTPGLAVRNIYENPNMSRDTSYSYDSPNAMLRYETNSGKPFAYVGGRGGFSSSQPDSLAKYKEVLSAPFRTGTDMSSAMKQAEATERLSRGKYAHGGELPKADFGDYFQSSGQASIGKGVGSAIGTVFGGPLGSMVGGALGSVVGNLFGGARDAQRLREFQEKTKKNTDRAAIAQGADAIHGQYSNVMEYGGYMNPDYNPQVITKFGDLTAQDFAKASKEMRDGGHLRDNHFYETDQYAMGGDLKVHRGKAETMSYNPYLPEGGETIMFKGPSHDDGGMPISYGENGVEVEGGEPAVKLQDGGSPDGNLVVFGNMKIPSYGVTEIGDDKAKGKKFKNYVAELSKAEAKQNKIIDKAIGLANDANTSDPFSQLSLNASNASLLGANMKLKQIAAKKEAAARVQNAILDTAEEFGVESDGLAKGEMNPIKDPLIGKNGKRLKKGQSGLDLIKGLSDEELLDPRYPERMKALKDYMEYQKTHRIPYQAAGQKDVPKTGKDIMNDVMSGALRGIPRSEAFNDEYVQVPFESGTGNSTALEDVVVSASKKGKKAPEAPAAKADDKKKKNKKDYSPLAMALLSGLGEAFRPSNQMGLDPDQLMGEYYALGQNQIEPVQAQQVQPLLEQPYDISLQDQLNEITAQARAAERMAGNNPAAAAMIFAQAAEAKNKVLGEQFRMNQANKAQVYNKNRELLGQTQLQNLAILDKQYERQAQAKSNTKAQAIEALKSIGDKITQNKAENLKMGVMENLYNFRFDNRGRAINFNPLTVFNEQGNPGAGGTGGYGPMVVGGKTLMPIDYDDKTGEPTKWKAMKKGGKVAPKNGSIVKAIKNL